MIAALIIIAAAICVIIAAAVCIGACMIASIGDDNPEELGQ